MTNSKERKDTTIRGRYADGAPNAVDIYMGNRVRLRRTMLGMTQQHLARKLGLTFQQVQKYEKGLNRMGGSRLVDIALALGVDLNFFAEDMNDEIKFHSPMMYSLSDDEKVRMLEGDYLDQGKDPLKKSESIRLVRAYFKIHNRRLAKQMLSVMETISCSNSNIAKG